MAQRPHKQRAYGVCVEAKEIRYGQVFKEKLFLLHLASSAENSLKNMNDFRATMFNLKKCLVYAQFGLIIICRAPKCRQYQKS